MAQKPPKPQKSKEVQIPKEEKKVEEKVLPELLTDKNSLYRKSYNTNLDFFIWVIENEDAPYIFKLHV